MRFGRPFYFVDDVAVGVRNLDTAVKWYSAKLGVSRNFLRSNKSEAFLAFSMEDGDPGVTLVSIQPGESGNVERHPILFTKNIEDAYRYFFRQGISTGPISSDSGGNRFFEFQDLEGNRIEVCTEPGL